MLLSLLVFVDLVFALALPTLCGPISISKCLFFYEKLKHCLVGGLQNMMVKYMHLSASSGLLYCMSQHQARWHSVIQHKYYIWDTSFMMSQQSVTLPTFTHLTSGETAEPHNRCGTCDLNTRPKYSQNKTLVLLFFTLQTVTMSIGVWRYSTHLCPGLLLSSHDDAEAS